jgi:tRNA G10  N-methylase Trm11
MVDTTATVGWRPTCNHHAPAIPAIVLDPFAGTFTTGMAAQKLGRRAVGVDISESYLEQAVRRLSAVTLPMGI